MKYVVTLKSKTFCMSFSIYQRPYWPTLEYLARKRENVIQSRISPPTVRQNCCGRETYKAHNLLQYLFLLPNFYFMRNMQYT